MLHYIILVIAFMALVTSFLLNLIQKFRKSTNANGEEEPGDPGYFWGKRGSSRTSAFKRKPNKPLNEFLDENLKTGDNVQFQSSFPWKTYVTKYSRYESKVQALDQAELKLYESIFELILTEKSYLSQLEHLIKFSDEHSELDEVFSKYDKNLLFGNIRHLHDVNHRMFCDFEDSFQEDIFMGKMFPILSKYLTNGSLEPYIDYIKGHQERNRLINDEDKCQTVPDLVKLRSLIIVPMQRITRYPLLVQNIFSIMDKILSKTPKSPVAKNLNRATIEKCLQDASKLASKCNKALDDERKLFDLIQFKTQLFGGLKIDDLVAPNREILSRTLAKIYFLKNGGGAVGVPASKGSVFKPSVNSLSKVKSTLILLTDMLILTEHKSKKNQYIVIDYDKLRQVQFERRRNSVISSGSNESIEKLSDENSTTPSKASCTITLRSNDSIYGVTFISPDDEDKFARQFYQLQSEQSTQGAGTNGRVATNGY